jgi:hypothetical protein
MRCQAAISRIHSVGGAGFLETRCQVHLPQPGQFKSRRGLPEAPHRIPPRSQVERACPHGQVCIHSRDSASIDFAEASGNTAIKSFWMKDIVLSYLFTVPIRKQF